jgi:hypothetical protein
MDRPNIWRAKFYKEREAIEEECVRRLKAGEEVYRERDVTAKIANLMGHDLITEIVQELLDLRNYTDMMIIKVKTLGRAMEHDKEVQKVLPSGKAKVATTDASCTLNA